MKETGKKKWIVVAVIAVIALAGVFVAFRAKAQNAAGSEYQTAKIERGNLVATVGATGTVRANQTARIVWQTNGTVESVRVAVGDNVRANDVLATLSSTSLPQSIILARADLVAAQRALEDVQNSTTAGAQAAIALRAAQEEFDSAQNYRDSLDQPYEYDEIVYVTQRIGTQYVKVPQVKTRKIDEADQETKDKADERLALAQAKLDDAQRAYDRFAAGPNADDIAAAQARVDAAQATLNMARLIAPFDGVITQSELMPGDQVSAGTLGFRIDDLSHLLVDVEISEVDINSVAPGQIVTMTFDAILDKEYQGKIVEVSQVGTNLQGVVNFTVTVELQDPDDLVRPGMTAAVNIVVKEIKDALLVPNRAVRLVDGNRVIYLLKDGAPEMVEIRLGASADTMSVLVSNNIAEGDLVILNPPSNFNLGGPPGGHPGGN